MKKTISLLFLIGFTIALSLENLPSSKSIFKSTQMGHLERRLEGNAKLKTLPLTSSPISSPTSAHNFANNFSQSQFIFVSSKPPHSSVNTVSKPNEPISLEDGDQSAGTFEGKPLLVIVLLLLGIVLLMGMIWLMDQQHLKVEPDSKSTQKD